LPRERGDPRRTRDATASIDAAAPNSSSAGGTGTVASGRGPGSGPGSVAPATGPGSPSCGPDWPLSGKADPPVEIAGGTGPPFSPGPSPSDAAESVLPSDTGPDPGAPLGPLPSSVAPAFGGRPATAVAGDPFDPVPDPWLPAALQPGVELLDSPPVLAMAAMLSNSVVAWEPALEECDPGPPKEGLPLSSAPATPSQFVRPDATPVTPLEPTPTGWPGMR